MLSTCVVKSKSVNPDAPKDGLQEVVHFEIKWDKIKKTTMVPYWDVGQESKCIICGVLCSARLLSQVLEGVPVDG